MLLRTQIYDFPLKRNIYIQFISDFSPDCAVCTVCTVWLIPQDKRAQSDPCLESVWVRVNSFCVTFPGRPSLPSGTSSPCSDSITTASPCGNLKKKKNQPQKLLYSSVCPHWICVCMTGIRKQQRKSFLENFETTKRAGKTSRKTPCFESTTSLSAHSAAAADFSLFFCK